MIAVIGCVKETVSIIMRPSREEPDQGFGGAMQPLQPQEEKERDDDKIIVRDSGCGYNIAANLALWGYDVEMISAVGDDTLGTAAIAGLDKAGVGREGVAVLAGDTAIDIEYVNILGDVEMSAKNRRMLKNITPDFLKERAGLLDGAEAIVVDGSLPQETIDYISATYGPRDEVKLFFDPADRFGGARGKGALSGFHCVMPGRREAEAMSGRQVMSEEEMSRAGEFFMNEGVERAVITIKGGGLYYREGTSEGILRPERVISFANTSGAGDVISAAMVAGALEGKSMEETVKDAMEKAALFLGNVEDKHIYDDML